MSPFDAHEYLNSFGTERQKFIVSLTVTSCLLGLLVWALIDLFLLQ